MQRNKRWMCAALMAVLLVAQVAFPVGAAAAKAAIGKKTAVIDLANGSTLQLNATASPASAANSLVWKSGNTAIATVSSSGLITAKKTGKVKVGVRVRGEGAWSICQVRVINTAKGAMPSSIVLSATRAELVIGETFLLAATVKPATASQAVTWQSSNNSVVTISTGGLLTAKKAGTAYVRAESKGKSSVKKTIPVKVTAAAMPTKLSLTPADSTMDAGDELQLRVSVSPEGASEKVKWETSDPTVATVSASGLVFARKAGKVIIRATSSAKSSVRASRTITVLDPDAVTSIAINQADMYLDKGESAGLSATIKPDSSKAKVTWSTSDPSIAIVTTSGKVTARTPGTVTITAKAGGKTDNVEVRVISTDREESLPAKYVTSAGAITANHNKITALYKSALEELETHVAKKAISSSERAERKEMIQRGFLMYDVPWAVRQNVRYWSGSTNYVPGRIYFGMPYTQTRRTFNLSNWLSNIPYTKGDGYYEVTMPNVSYPGNDCSSFVSMCQFGTNSNFSYLNSRDMYASTQYKTVSNGFSKLIPGDVLVKNGHVAMFLYYVSSDRIMVLEQGGGAEPNTVACHIKSITSMYKAQGYRVRRKASLPSAR